MARTSLLARRVHWHGMASLVFSIALGLGQVLLHHKGIVPIMNLVGAAFLLWLSWKIATADPTIATKDKKAVGFVNAALFQWINPKSWIVSTGAIGAYFHSDSSNAVLYSAAFASPVAAGRIGVDRYLASDGIRWH